MNEEQQFLINKQKNHSGMNEEQQFLINRQKNHSGMIEQQEQFLINKHQYSSSQVVSLKSLTIYQQLRLF